jgi:hypothetical protein
MSDKDTLELAKDILEQETLEEGGAIQADAVKPSGGSAVDTSSKNKKQKETPTVDTDSVEDSDLTKVAGEDKGASEVNAPVADGEEENQGSIATKASAATALKTQEHMDALFGGEELSEDFRNKAEVIFTSALNERTEAIRAELQEEFDAHLTEETAKISDELSEKLDDYLNYVVKEWADENQIAIEHGLKNEISESFIGDLKNLFENHNIEVPEEQFDALAEANEKAETLESKLNEQLQSNIDLVKRTEELERINVFSASTNGLTDTEVETLRSLAEGVEFESTEQYAEKLNILKENYFSNDVSATTSDEEENTIVEQTTYPKQMDTYLQSLTRIHKATNKSLN